MLKRIRIMHVVDNLGRGGLENGLVNLTHGLDPARFENIVYTIRGLGPNAARLPRDVKTISLDSKETDSRIHLPLLVRAIRTEQPDIVHSRNWAAVEAVLAGWLLRSCALVHSEHGVLSDPNTKEPKRRVWFRRLAFELADQVLSVSYQLRDLQAKRTKFPAERINVIHNGVESDRFFPDDAARHRIREELQLSDDVFCIGCVGNLFPVKDHMTLLKSIGLLAEQCSDWRLFFIGDGPERKNLEAFVNARPGWNQRVTFLGSSDRVAELLRVLDVYVLPSISEGMSNSILEAMATGLPVVVTNTGGNPEIVVDGESGLLFPVGDFHRLAECLLLLRKQPELRSQLAEQAVRRVRNNFSIDSMVRKYEQVYERVAQTAAAPLQATARV